VWLESAATVWITEVKKIARLTIQEIIQTRSRPSDALHLSRLGDIDHGSCRRCIPSGCQLKYMRLLHLICAKDEIRLMR